MKHPYLAKLRFLLFVLLGLTCSFGAAWAQSGTGTISGRVADSKKEGLPGVTVLVEGTTLGSSTNVDGTYSITGVPAGPHTLVISFVGYTNARQTVTVVAGQNTAVPSQTLSENATALNEAVVIGYGTQRKQDNTGAVEQISEKQFVKGQVTNPEQLIQGKVAGVQITTGGGAPGSGTEIRIRGGSSLSSSNSPLIVIDGVPIDDAGIAGASNPLTLINPNDIESVTVLKDASSTAIYGIRASNGVIIITTKQGLVGEPIHVDVSTLHSIATVAKYSDVLSADQFRTLVKTYGTTGQQAVLGTANTDWQKAIFRNAYSADNNISIRGAAGWLPYRISVGYLTQEGLLKHNDLHRNTASISLTPMLLNGNLHVTVNVKGSLIDNDFSNQGAVGAAIVYDPTQPITSDAPAFAPYGGYFQSLDPSGNGHINTLATLNPVGLVNQYRNRSSVQRSIGNAQFDYKLPFITGLSANVNAGYDLQRGAGSIDAPPTAGAYYLTGGANNHYHQAFNNTLLEVYGKYDHVVGPGRLELLAGYSFQKFQHYSYLQDGNNYSENGSVAPGSLPVAPNIAGTYTNIDTNVLEGYYSRLNYNIGDKYLFTGTYRADGTSRFNPKHFGFFPAGAVAWRIKGEDFLKNSTIISELKLRVGYGQTGQQNNNIGGYYPYLPSVTLSNLAAQYQLGDQFYQTLRPNQYNPNITWETTTTLNLGLDYGFFDGRFYGSLDVYNRDTKNLLNFIPTPALFALSNAGTYNIGSLTNKGAEIVANLQLVKSDRLNITVNANATYNQTKLTKLTLNDLPTDTGQPTGGIGGGVGNTIQVNKVGYSPGDFYVYQQAYDANGKPIEGVYVDRNGDGKIDSQDKYIYKHSRAPYLLGGGANVSYRGVSLAFSMRANLQGYVYNNVRSGSYYDTNTNGFLSNKNSEILASGFRSAQYFSDYYVENGSFLRMDNATLGYNFGNLIKKGSNLNLSFAVQNVFIITKYKGIDPEITGGIDNTIYPRPRTFTVGLNLGI